MSEGLAQAFLSALANAAGVLEAGDAEAAVGAMADVDTARDAAQSAWAPFTADELRTAVALEARCQRAMKVMEAGLLNQMQQSGTTRKAVGAYVANGGSGRIV